MDNKKINQASSIKQNNCECSNDKEECKGEVIDSYTINECISTSSEKFPHYKVPVIISEFKAQIDLESRIKLCEPAIEIKRIKKNVFLTQCRLVAGTRKVFISGYVRKNIEYATMNCYNNSAICGDIKHTTVHVPFKCVTEIMKMREPEIHPNEPSKMLNYYDGNNMGSSMKEIDMFSEEIFNEKVYCELVSAKIYEADIIEDCKNISSALREHTFQNFIEKEVIYLTIKLLQNQQICEEREPKCPSYYDWMEQQEC